MPGPLVWFGFLFFTLTLLESAKGVYQLMMKNEDYSQVLSAACQHLSLN